MDLSYKILWFEDTDEWFDVMSNRVQRCVESKNLKYHCKRFKSKEQFILNKYNLNDYEILIIDLRLADSTSGTDVINEIRKGNYVNDILFYSAEGDASLRNIMKDNSLEGVFVAERDNRKFYPKLEKLINKSVKRSENVINIRGIVMDETSKFDYFMCEIYEMAQGLLNREQISVLHNYAIKLLSDRQSTITRTVTKYSTTIDDPEQSQLSHSLSDIIKNREFTSMMKCKFLNKLLNLENDNIRGIRKIIDGHFPDIKSKFNFFEYYNNEIISFRNALAHVKNVTDTNGPTPTFIGNIAGESYYCDETFCSTIRESLIKYSSFFDSIYNFLESI